MTKARGPNGRFISTKPVQALTAAASVIPTRAIDNLPRSPEGWQTRAWRLWRLLGIVHQPTSYKAKQVGRLKWNISIDGELMDQEEAAEVLEAVTSPLGTAEAARRIALNLEVAGQVFYTRSKNDWNVYAATTPKLKEKLKASDIIVEGINPDPEDPAKPTSSIMAALNTAEAIRLMSQMSRAQDRNRLAQRGILLVPKEGIFPEGDDFASTLEEVSQAPIADEYAASAVTPPIVYYPSEYIEKWRHLVLESPYDDKLMDRIGSMVRQFAQEIDMPVEVLLGNLDSNHWNAWLSSAENYTGHVEPLANGTGEVFAEALEEAAGASPQFAGRVIKVIPDPSEMLVARPSLDERFKAYELGLVNGDFVRNGLGADEEDMMGDEEFERLLILKGLAPEQMEEPADDQNAPAMVPANGNGSQPAIAAAADSPDADLDELGDRLADIDQNLLVRLTGAAEMTTSQVRAIVDATDVGAQQAVAEEVHRLGTTWGRMVDQAQRVLLSYDIDTTGEEWETAKQVSIELLEDGMTAWITERLDKPDSEVGEVPTDLLWLTLAAAGGSGTAVIAALTSPRGLLPPPTPADPRGFAVGVLSNKKLRENGLTFTQWRWRYGTAVRQRPFHFHKEQDGRFADRDGIVAGWWPQDHLGCRCGLAPVYRKASVPAEVT